MVSPAVAHSTSEVSVRLSHRDLEIIQLGLKVLLQESTREEHIFGPIREAMSKIDGALRQPGEQRKAS